MKSSTPLTPKELMAQHIEHAEKTGNSIASDKTTRDGTRKIVFKDGGKLHLHQTGVMIRKFPDGKKVQYNSAGKHTTVRPRPCHEVFSPDAHFQNVYFRSIPMGLRLRSTQMAQRQ